MREFETGRYRDKVAEALPGLLQALRAGTPVNWAARGAGITEKTFYNWQAKANDGDPYFVWVFEQINEARGIYVTGAQATLTKHGNDGDSRAIMFALERQYPSEYGIRQRVDHGNADGRPFRVQATPLFDPEMLTTEELETLVRLLSKARPSDLPIVEARRPPRELLP